MTKGEALKTATADAVVGNSATPEVLVVDDDRPVLDELVATVASDGLECIGATSGRQALGLLRAHPSLVTVLVDLRMPEMDGFALMHAIRDSIAPGLVPSVICVSGHLDMDATVVAMRQGARDCLTKPVGRRQLLDSVQSAVRTAREEREQDAEQAAMRVLVQDLSVRLAQAPIRLGGRRAVEVVAPGMPPDYAVTNSRGSESKTTVDKVTRLVQERDFRREVFGDGLFSDPAWDMLLDLVQNELGGYATYVSSLSVGARVPLSTTSRYLDLLEKAEFLARLPDPEDGRRVHVKLTDKGWNLVRKYLGGLS